MLFNTRVVVGQISLITDDVPYEKAYEIFNIIKFDGKLSFSLVKLVK